MLFHELVLKLFFHLFFIAVLLLSNHQKYSLLMLSKHLMNILYGQTKLTKKKSVHRSSGGGGGCRRRKKRQALTYSKFNLFQLVVLLGWYGLV